MAKDSYNTTLDKCTVWLTLSSYNQSNMKARYDDHRVTPDRILKYITLIVIVIFSLYVPSWLKDN